MLADYGGGLDVNCIPTVTTRTKTFTNALPTDSQTITTTYNFGMLQFSMINVVFNSPQMSDNEMFEIYLSHLGTEMIVFKGTVGEFKAVLNSRVTGQSISFKESGYVNFFSLKGIEDPSTNDFQFFESCLMFKNIAPGGVWICGVRSPKNSFSITFDYNVVLLCGNDIDIPSQSPYISKSNEELVLSYQTTYPKNNMRFLVSPTLLPVLDFFADVKFDSTLGMHICYFPADILSTTLTDIITSRQPESKINKLKNVSRIILKSNSLSTNQETFITSDNNILKDSILTDFTINTDDPLGNNLIYTLDPRSWRLYNIPNGVMRRIAFEVTVLYSNGISSPLYTATGENYLIRFSIF
jgi:hypothetical protein